MFKKVTGAAKDRFKQHLQHQHAPPSRVSRPPRMHAMHGNRAYTNPAVTLKSVDDSNFERILDDESDFTGYDFSTPLSSSEGSERSGALNSYFPDSPSSSQNSDSDLFNNEDSSPQTSLDCDPLSGQIVSKSSYDTRSRSNSDGIRIQNVAKNEYRPKDDGMDTRNKVEVEYSANTTDKRDNELMEGNPGSGYPGNSHPWDSTYTVDSGLMGEGSLFDQVDNQNEESEHSKPDNVPEFPFHNMEEVESEMKPSDVSHSEHQFFSSSPSDSQHMKTSPLSHDKTESSNNKHHLSLESNTPAENTQIHPPIGIQIHPHTSAIDISSELEQLLAPAVSKVSNKVPTSSPSPLHPLRSRSISVEQKGEDGHLDSGVFEHDTEPYSFPEKGGEEGGAGKVNRDDNLFPIQTEVESVTKQTTFSYSENKSNISPLLVPKSQSQSPQGKKKTPPPRPPLSLIAKRKILDKSLATRVVVDDGVEQVKSLPVSGARDGTKPEQVGQEEVNRSEERLPPDDLFLDDLKKTDQPLTIKQDHKTGFKESLPRPTSTSPEKQQELNKEDKTSKSQEESKPELTLPYHLVLSAILYFYYSLNIFPYLAGFFAGFFVLYLLLGSLFIYYVYTVEEKIDERKQGRKTVQLSEDFVKTMRVDFTKLKEYQSNQFLATLSYDVSTHHPSQRMKTEIKLFEDFKLFIEVTNENYYSLLCTMVDIRQCSIYIEPLEVAQNRKRRWSKKFPIVISCTVPEKRFKLYLFSPTARDKEDWFRRMRNASSGLTSRQLIARQKEFFGYMEKYFPPEMLQSITLKPSRTFSPAKQNHHSYNTHHRSGNSQQRKPNTLVQFSKTSENASFASSNSGVNITDRKTNEAQQSNYTSQASQSATPTIVHQSSVDPVQNTLTSSPLLDKDDFEYIQYPIPSRQKSRHQLSESAPNQWLNSMAARLCWDVWHEAKWKEWVMVKIQKKLIRTKTPSFMEQLRLTDIDIGNDMPMINRLIGGPRLDLQGIWVYLDVTYQGKFVMTIETKMKLGGVGSGGQSLEEEGEEMTEVSRNKEGSRTKSSSSSHSYGHTHAVHAFSEKGTPVDPEDEIDSGSDEEERSGHHHPLLEEELAITQGSKNQEHLPSSHTPTPHPSSVTNKGRLKSMVTRVAKKMANTKIVRRAAEKVSGYPLVLTVEVNRLDGVLAVNIPPPPSDTIWWGFHGSPKLELTAKPKFGHREVKLSTVTHWIEKKLCEIVDKKIVLPEMEDLAISILNSGMPEDKQKPISSDSDPSNV